MQPPFYSPSYSAPLSSPCFERSPFPADYPETPSPEPKKPRRPKDQRAAVRQRKAANERERRRMFSINKGFDRLRDRLPMHMPIDKKLSKVDTLKTAIEYIHQLHAMIADAPNVSTAQPSHNPCITISTQDDPCAKLTISWHRKPMEYGSAFRDQMTGATKASCSKVWIPGV
uniref:BHLH domain-containing protein n=2 Tax=Steinernema glaseri TaxID=37863 RepID=A0A1I7Y356_9BILA